MAGVGSRMNINQNKVLLPLNNKPVFMHSYDKFKEKGLEIICVINPTDEEQVRNYLPDAKITFGGSTRQESVYNGLLKCSGDYVFIHDAARPLLSNKVIDDLIEKSNQQKPILTYHKCKNTIKDISVGIKTIDRENIILATTPQCSSLEDMLYCHNKAKKDNYLATDDIALIEKYLCKEIILVEANEENFKITTKLDYELANLILKEQ
jgi:2-C-methyl-D-erythritol 4-phosphate cytidylyltransferase